MRDILTNVCFALLLISSTLSAEPLSTQRFKLSFVPYKTPTKYEKAFATVDFTFGLSPNTQILPLRPDLSAGASLVGIQGDNLNDWGLTGCLATGSTGDSKCEYSVTISSKKYFERTYTTNDLQVPMQYPGQAGADLNSRMSFGGLSSRSESGKAVFPLGATGVLSLAPTSSFYQWMFTQHSSPNTIVGLDLKLARLGSWWDSTSNIYVEPSNLILSGEVKYAKSITNLTLPTDITHWSVPSASLSLGDEKIVDGQLVCFTNAISNTITVDPSYTLLEKINKAICNSDKPCSADDNRVPRQGSDIFTKLTINMELKSTGEDKSAKLIIVPDVFMYSAGGSINADMSSDFASIIAQQICPPNTKIILGRNFFSLYTTHFSVSKSDGKKMIYLEKKKIIKEMSPSEKVLVLTLGLGMVGLCAVVLAIKYIVDGKTSSPDEYAAAAQN